MLDVLAEEVLPLRARGLRHQDRLVYLRLRLRLLVRLVEAHVRHIVPVILSLTFDISTHCCAANLVRSREEKLINENNFNKNNKLIDLLALYLFKLLNFIFN